MFFARSTPATKLLMVCMANVCRSPMAQAVAAHMASRAGLGRSLLVNSAGTHASRGSQAPDPRACAVLSARGYPVGKGRSRQISDQDFEEHELILAMDQGNLNELRGICPAEHAHKLRLLLEFAEGLDTRDIPDPYYGNLQGFERVLDLCETGVRGLLRQYQPPAR